MVDWIVAVPTLYLAYMLTNAIADWLLHFFFQRNCVLEKLPSIEVGPTALA